MKPIVNFLPGLVSALLVLGINPAAFGAEDAPGPQVIQYLAAIKGKLQAPEAQARLPGELRLVLDRTDVALAAEVRDPSRRATLREQAKKSLTEGLAAELGGPEGAARAGGLVEKAWQAVRQGRVDVLERNLICWCREENWTRTLAGCPEGCSREQKTLLRTWIDEGLTNDEIVDRMEAHPSGGPRVRAQPPAEGSNWIGYAFPLVAAVAALWVALRWLGRARRVPAPPGDSSAGGAHQSEEDARIGERIERELKEMGE